jgi:ribosomal protein S27AE
MRMWRSSVTLTQELTIDLSRLTCGQSRIGGAVAVTDWFATSLLKRGVFADKRNGIEIGCVGGRLDYVFVTVNYFPGQIVRAGTRVHLNTETTEVDIVLWFGAPYWIDRSNGETILFYEYQEGHVEIQFELWDGKRLSHLTMARDGVLSELENRLSYGVTRIWPPKNVDQSEVVVHDPHLVPSGGYRPSVCVHMLIDVVVCLGGTILTWMLMFVLWPYAAIEKIIPSKTARITLSILPGLLGFGVGALLSKWWRTIPARCKKCGGRTLAEGTRPVRYLCGDCGFLEVTHVWRKWGRK